MSQKRSVVPKHNNCVCPVAVLSLFSNLLLNLLSPGSCVRLEKLTVSQLVKKFPVFCGTVVYSCVHKSTQIFPVLSHINLVHAPYPVF